MSESETPNLPTTASETKTVRAAYKRRITGSVKDAKALLNAGEGIPDVQNSDPDFYEGDDAFEKAEQEIAEEQDFYYDEVREKTLPTMFELLRRSEKLIPPDKPVVPPTWLSPKPPDISIVPCMEKLKFPTFTGDIRDYRRFRKQFLHFTKHLGETETFYQLIESMEKPKEKNKIKNCVDVCKAWEILDESYGDENHFIETLIADMECVDTYEIKGKVNLQAMERFVETLQNFSTQMESLGMKGDLNSRVMLAQVRRKLPEDHRIAFLRDIRDNKIDESMNGLVDWLHSHLVLLQKAKAPGTNSTDNSTKLGKFHRAVNSSTMFPGGGGRNRDSKKYIQVFTDKRNGNQLQPKCPLHPRCSNHFIKGCFKFRSMTQAEKLGVLKANNICQRCGHNNCVSGKTPYNYSDCQFVTPCQIPTCGADTHFASICPRVYGTDGYEHFEISKSEHGTNMNCRAREFVPRQNTSNVIANVMSTVTDKNRISCVLPTIMAYIYSGTKKILVRVLLDTGSQVSLIRNGILPRLVNEQMQDYSLTTVGGGIITRKLRVVECVLESIDGSFSRNIRLTEMEKPCGNVPVVTNQQIQQYPHLVNIEIVEPSLEVIDVLLGVENGDILTTIENIIGPSEDDPIAARCLLGWYIQGGRGSKGVNSSTAVNFTQVAAVSDIQDFLGLERMGMEPKHCKCAEDKSNEIATDAMRRSITKLKDGSYQISLPWRKPLDNLPNNYDYAVRRLLNLEKQFRNRPKQWQVYCHQMNDQLSRGVARLVPKDELSEDLRKGKKMWFLPHFGVLKESDSTPVRVVYDAKSRFQGHSLNDYLAKGDNLNTNLFEIALRFREYEVGVIADISKMFQAVKMTPDDARYHRYVFRSSPNDPIKVYELTRVTFGDTSSPTAATVALRHVAAVHAPDDAEIQRVIATQFYVDDLSDSQRSLDSVMSLKTNLTTALERGNFRIRKWQSNRHEICDPGYYPVNGETSVLGTLWNLRNDKLKVKGCQLRDLEPTKRNILKKTASYYDIFGMLSGILIRPKILLQKLWQFEIDWDTPISPESDLYFMWKAIERDLEDIDKIELPRCLVPDKFHGWTQLPKVSIHGASDASEDAMGMGIWLRWSDGENEQAELTFVCARARLTPMKQSSIPRKELQAMLLLSRLMSTVKNALRLPIDYTKLWTDSMTVISWLRGQSKSFRSYVAYRVGEITTEFDADRDIAYVPTELNVIDHVSRGVKYDDMLRVIDGPIFLKDPPASWPVTPSNVPVEKDDPEQKKFHIRNAKVLAVNLTIDEPIVDPTKFSSWTRLLMVTARVLSLKDLPRRRWLKDLTTKLSEWPSMKCIREAESYWIRQAQKNLNFENHQIMKLNPFLSEKDKIYRVGGRIRNAPLSYDIRHPCLLPKDHHVSLLIVRERHRHVLHCGHLRTATEVRKNYWIIGDTNLCRRVVRDCIVCRRYKGKPLHQQMADLPDFRVRPCTPPFQTTAVDYLGPVNVRLTRNTVSKGYCAVFTCTVTRAVHLTCVQDLSTSAFLQALERFINIRGAPKLILSDNATCFRGADNEIRDLQLRLDQPKVRECCLRYKTEWKFGPPGGPHHQGTVERMVQEIKKSMRHLVLADKLSFVEWETIFTQISGLLNSRPLTVLSSSPLDDQPITPNHFLIGRGDLPCPSVPCDDYIGDTRKRRELCNSMVDGFWRRWMSNIQKLSPRHKWSSATDNLAKGDIVLVVDEKAKRGHWEMAVVNKVYYGQDGLVRIVNVRQSDGHELKRPITKLILLMKNYERMDYT